MKKFICAVAAVVVAFSAFAEGYQVNTLSARQGGMAHTGVAQKLGAESMYFNPAGLAFMKQSFDISGNFNAVISTASATENGVKYTTDNEPSTPLMFNAGFTIYPNLKAGVSFYTPYGSGINWGQSWPGAVLNQKVSLKTFTLQPTFSWKPIKNLAIGAGLTISWGNVNLNKGLINPNTMDTMIGLMQMAGQLPPEFPLFKGTTPASINLLGNSSVAVGFNVGVMYDILPNWTVGAQYRSKTTLGVKVGDVTVEYANQFAQTLLENSVGLIDQANFKAEMPMPWVFTFGTSFKPIDKLLLALDLQLTGWNAYKELNIEFLDPNLQGFNQNIIKNYKNSWAFRLGGQYNLTNRFDVRAGLILDLSPVNKSYYNPETPGMTKIEPSIGLSFRPIPSVSIDLSMLYVHGMGADGSGTYADMLAPSINKLLPPGAPQLPLTQTFAAHYKVNAWVPSIGISYSFGL